MISDELKNILDKITNQGKMCFLEGATEEQILAVAGPAPVKAVEAPNH